MKNPLFSRKVPSSAKGYSAFPMDNLANFTSVCGYLLPVYWDYLEPGDKVTCQTLLRTRTQPLSKPAMATCIERIEWFAVPIQQLYKLFGSKFYGIQDNETDLLPISGVNDLLPCVNLDSLNALLVSLPTSFTAQSAVPTTIPTLDEAKRLCDCLGLPKSLGSAAMGENSYFTSVSLLPFAAYHKIYFDHYRLTDREVNDPEYYNLDSYFGTSSKSALLNATADTARLRKLLMLHKRPYQREYFTSMQVSPLFGSQSTNAIGSDLNKVSQWLSGLSSVAPASPGSNTRIDVGGGFVAPDNATPTTVRHPTTTGGSSGSVSDAIIGIINPANLRSMYAVEKLLEVTRRAKKHYDMQTLAHFGVSVPKGLSGECFKLGTHEQFLKIGDVMSTAETNDGSLGELAGQASSEGQSKKIHFEADCHCVLMAIYSAEPVVNYGNDGTPRINTQVYASDFYRSEFDNLGMQPVFMHELLSQRVTADYSYYPRSVVGWNYRYYQLKSKYNRSFAGCTSSFFQEWSLNKSAPSGGSSLSRNFFYVWPTDFNNVLQVPFTGNINFANLYSQDYFINQIYFNVIKSSKKSIYGEPNL